MRKLVVLCFVLITSGLLAVPTASAAPRSCSVVWGSLLKSSDLTSPDSVTGVRTGRHDCYDRVVVDLEGAKTGYRIEYVKQLLADGSGAQVPVAGGAILKVVVHAPAYDVDSGKPTVDGAVIDATNVAGYRTLRDVAWGNSFEGYTTLGLGVRARLPFRVFSLAGPGNSSRLVIDIAHSW